MNDSRVIIDGDIDYSFNFFRSSLQIRVIQYIILITIYFFIIYYLIQCKLSQLINFHLNYLHFYNIKVYLYKNRTRFINLDKMTLNSPSYGLPK